MNKIKLLIIMILTYIISYRITMMSIVPEKVNEHTLNLRVYGFIDQYFVD